MEVPDHATAPGLMRLIVAEIAGMIAPPLCAGCPSETSRAAEALCGHCLERLERLRRPACPRCAQPLPCPGCPAADAPWLGATAACAHEGTARALVGSLKRSGARRIADRMAVEIAAVLPAESLRSAVFVPVAAHPARRRASGVDHAFELARSLSRITGRPTVRALVRSGGEARQAGAPRAVRLEPGRITFAAVTPVPRRVVLVDDVLTTGATLGAASTALLGGSAESVSCVAFARALGPAPRLRPLPGW